MIPPFNTLIYKAQGISDESAQDLWDNYLPKSVMWFIEVVLWVGALMLLVGVLGFIFA